MDNSTQKLIAKIQHFYDLLTLNSERHGDHAIALDEQCERMEATAILCEYHMLSSAYRDVFKEFIYDEDSK